MPDNFSENALTTNKYSFIVCDCETTSLNSLTGDIVELSLIRMSDGEQRTWCFKALNPSGIEAGALRVNGHKLEDITWQTKEGRDRYMDPNTTIVEIENWLAEDNVSSESRFIVGHNGVFDKQFLEQLWTKCNSKDTFPFGRRVIDTMVLELALDYAKGQFAEGYSLNNLVKKYQVKNDKAHTAASDTLATKEVFGKQISYLQKLIKND